MPTGRRPRCTRSCRAASRPTPGSSTRRPGTGRSGGRGRALPYAAHAREWAAFQAAAPDDRRRAGDVGGDGRARSAPDASARPVAPPRRRSTRTRPRGRTARGIAAGGGTAIRPGIWTPTSSPRSPRCSPRHTTTPGDGYRRGVERLGRPASASSATRPRAPSSSSTDDGARRRRRRDARPAQ